MRSSFPEYNRRRRRGSKGPEVFSGQYLCQQRAAITTQFPSTEAQRLLLHPCSEELKHQVTESTSREPQDHLGKHLGCAVGCTSHSPAPEPELSPSGSAPDASGNASLADRSVFV